MRVLWVTNTIFPDLSKSIGIDVPSGGGWMYGLASDLVKNGINLVVVTARPNLKRHHTKINGITYYILKSKKPILEYDSSLEKQWQLLIEEIKPDLVHIQGTEYAHGLSLLKTRPDLKYVVSIQGLISVCARYYTGQIPKEKIKKYSTFRDYLRQDTLLQAQNKFLKRGEIVEKEYFKNISNFIGRTQWDYAHTKALNPEAEYHFCNESLRDAFYTSKKWDFKEITKYTIFLSQANYPLKGLHQIVKAISLLKEEFSGLKVRIAGGNIIETETFRNRLALSGYGNYLLHLIRKFKLQNNIEFIGFLDEQKMVREYLNCHLFICPSSIENSPNSLGEAQLLGVPCIASYVGGIPDMIRSGETGILYRFEEIEMLAQAIKKVFTDQTLAQKLSVEGIKEATKRHNRNTNLKRTLEIYHTI